MSLETWKQKYYKVHASIVPKEDALEHSILKWEGLHPSILLEHGIARERHELSCGDEKVFWIAGYSCALCENHLHDDCATCPISLATGWDCMRAYREFIEDGDTGPMMNALLFTKKHFEIKEVK